MLADVAKGSDELVVNFLRLVAEKGRAAEVAEIADELDALVAADDRVLDVELTTATELTRELLRAGDLTDRVRVGPQGAGLAQG